MPRYSELIYQIVTSHDSYGAFIDTLGELKKDSQKLELYRLIKNRFDTKKINDIINEYIDLGGVDIEERHWREAEIYEDRKELQSSYAGHVAAIEWSDNKITELNLIYTDVTAGLDFAGRPDKTHGERNYLPFIRKVSAAGLNEFMNELKNLEYISKETTIQDFRDIFGLSKNGHLNVPASRETHRPIVWIGPNVALTALIRSLASFGYLKKSGKKWLAAAQCFRRPHGALSVGQLRYSSYSSNKNYHEITDNIEGAIKLIGTRNEK